MDARREAIQAEMQRRAQLRAELNRRELSKRPEFQPVQQDLASKIGESLLGGTKETGKDLLAGAANVGHQLLNLPSNLLNLDAKALNYFAPDSSITKGVQAAANWMPRQAPQDFAGAIGAGKSGLDQAIQSAPEVPFYMAAPELKAPEALAKVPMIGRALSGTANAVGRGAPQVGVGAMMSEDPMQGAKDMSVIQAALEAAPLPFKAVGALAEKIHPQNFAKGLAKRIADGYKSAKATAKELYDPIFKAHGEKNIYQTDQPQIGQIGQRLIGDMPQGSPDIIGDTLQLSDRDVRRYLGKEVTDMYDRFQAMPTLNNAKDLRTTLGKKMSSKMQDVPDVYRSTLNSSLNYARDLVSKDMEHFLNRTDSNAMNQWQRATNYFRENVAPYRVHRGVYNLAKGQRSWVSPAQLKDTLRNAMDMRTDQGRFLIPREHMLGDALSEMEGKMNRSDLISNLANLVVGEMTMPGMVGLIGGQVVKPASKLTKTIHNPITQMLGETLERTLRKGQKPLGAGIFSATERNQS